jgi:hypothetical protein
VSLNIIFFDWVIRAVIHATADPIDISQKKIAARSTWTARSDRYWPIKKKIAARSTWTARSDRYWLINKKICLLESAAVCTRKRHSFLKSRSIQSALPSCQQRPIVLSQKKKKQKQRASLVQIGSAWPLFRLFSRISSH